MTQVYNREITIPANTLKTSPLTDEIILPSGIITKLTVGFAWGVAWLAGISLWRYNHQEIPSEIDTWITGNEIVYSFDVHVEILNEPFAITLYGFNEDELFEHTIQVGLTITESVLSQPIPIVNPNDTNSFIQNIISRARGKK